MLYPCLSHFMENVNQPSKSQLKTSTLGYVLNIFSCSAVALGEKKLGLALLQPQALPTVKSVPTDQALPTVDSVAKKN